ncbi:radical SAM protein [Desulfogranum mediterraneum]|uniref:radical SAM protein n=1 Tax=Desulfogranum mediterraneum TaxID=160661 RepID=UPI00048CB6D3|nr:radical SAM protein [Desulfogranum mediterraneum]
MRYEGPIYRPPSEADSLLIQATVGCPNNRCTFCMVYKDGTRYKVRPVKDIKEDMDEAAGSYGKHVQTLFFPAGNTIAMKTDDLAEICRYGKALFPNLERITVYGSSQYIGHKGPEGMKTLAEAGLSRIHVGLESGDDAILERIRKGTNSEEQIAAGRYVMDAGIELSLYVILGIGGKERTEQHAVETARVLNRISPDFIRLRTFVPKKNTPLLQDVMDGTFIMLSPHEVLEETAAIIKRLEVTSYLASDHYTNYLNIEGPLPAARERMLLAIEAALQKRENQFRPFFVGEQ